MAILSGAVRGGTPFLFVSLGECLTEKSGKINLGQEGSLLTGAMTAYAVSYHSGSPWYGVLAAMGVGMLLGLLFAWLSQLPRTNDIAVGIALMLFGSGIAFFFGKPYIQPSAPLLPGIPLGAWSSSSQIQAALRICPLFFLGLLTAFFLGWFLRSTRWGLQIRAAGDQPSAARALGISLRAARTWAAMAGSGLAAIGGSYLSLYYPGAWTEAISGGQGSWPSPSSSLPAGIQDVPCGLAALRRGSVRGPRAPGRRHPDRLLPLECLPLRPDADRHGHHLFHEEITRWCPGRPRHG
nr:ABC transporter permease [Verrucomicrobium spinosum]